MAIDPICGMTVDEVTGLAADKYGRTWHFCCDHCRRRFLGLPEDSHSSAPDPRPASRFFCPMCEGVVSDTPGVCPKCGMALEQAGGAGVTEDNTELRDMTRRFWIGLALGLPVVLLAMGGMIPGNPLPSGWSRWFELFLATPVALGCGWPFFVRAWQSLRHRSPNMFTLIGMGTGTAYAYSVLAVFAPGLFPESFRHHGEVAVYFESAAAITVLVLLGQVLELRARRKTGEALRALLRLAPDRAWVIREGVEVDLPADVIRAGDLVRVRPGERVAVDGTVAEGRSALDYSALTGEPMPVDVKPDDRVESGAVNTSGAFLMRATRVGAETTFARILKLVSDAQRSRAPIQRLADRVAAVFVPVVGLVALATFALWAWLGPEPRFAYAIISAVSVLIVACPCTLGLATPMAITVGIGRGARAGVLIRDAQVVERLERVDVVIVDKTGTLTEGRPTVAELHVEASFAEADVLRWAVGVEYLSEHSLARAIVRYAGERGIDPMAATEFAAEAGSGVSGVVGGRRVRVERAVERAVGQDPGHTLVQVVIDDRLAGTFALTDRVRETTPQAVAELGGLGVAVEMLSGDRPEVAESVGRALGIDRVMGGATPAAKIERVRALQREGRCVLMAGDGVNDAPALAAADVGVAMGTGTDAAMQSAGVTLVHGDLRGLVRALRLGRAVMRNIRQNLFWAFAYNLLGVPLAAGVLYPLTGHLMSPMLAAAAMSFSSVTVIGNALRLRRIRI